MPAHRFSANTGYLWQQLPFLERIAKAAQHGFGALEFHDEALHCDRSALKRRLAAAALPVLSLNVRIGDTFGCAAVPERSNEARRDIAAAVEIAEDIGAAAIHILAGIAHGPSAHETYLRTLRFALDATALTILIEPICHKQVPGYFLQTIEQAGAVVSQIGHPRLKILFDCYHVHHEGGSLPERFRSNVAAIGHVQISAAEDRGEPLPGALDYAQLLPAFRAAGYTGAFGCEYRPRSTTDAGLAWRDVL